MTENGYSAGESVHRLRHRSGYKVATDFRDSRMSSGSSDAEPAAAAATRSAICRWRTGASRIGVATLSTPPAENPYPVCDVDAEEPPF
jgi:hypothetical protein